MSTETEESCYVCSTVESTLLEVAPEIFQFLTLFAPELKWDNSCMFCRQCCGDLEVILRFRRKCLAAATFRNIPAKIEEGFAENTSDANFGENAQSRDKIVSIIKQETLVEVQNNLTISIGTDDDNSEIEEIVKIEKCIDASNVDSNEVQETSNSEDVFKPKSTTENNANNLTNNKGKPLRKRNRKEEPVLCKYCNCKVFRLWDHVRAKHTFEKPFKCDSCDKCFSSTGNLLVHKRAHLNDRPFICTTCGKAFKFSQNLRLHWLGAHEDPKNWKYLCPYCDKRFHVKKTLEAHMTQHTGEKKSVCDLCDKTFYDRSTLNKHIRLHSDERAFKCDLCPKDYRSVYALNVHRKREHNFGTTVVPKYVKKLSCEVCFKKFAVKSRLKQHMKSHAEVSGCFKYEATSTA